MKTKVLKPFYFAICLTIIFVSCKKDSTPKSNPELVSQKAWLIQKEEFKINADPYQDQFPSYPDCYKDNLFNFLISGVFNYTEGATKCNTEDPDLIGTSTWSLEENETKLMIGYQIFDIDQLDNNTLIVTNTEVSGPDTYYHRYTFKH